MLCDMLPQYTLRTNITVAVAVTVIVVEAVTVAVAKAVGVPVVVTAVICSSCSNSSNNSSSWRSSSSISNISSLSLCLFSPATLLIPQDLSLPFSFIYQMSSDFPSFLHHLIAPPTFTPVPASLICSAVAWPSPPTLANIKQNTWLTFCRRMLVSISASYRGFYPFLYPSSPFKKALSCTENETTSYHLPPPAAPPTPSDL